MGDSRESVSRTPGQEHGETTRNEQRARHRAQASAYQGAMEAIFSVVIAVGAGYWADETFDTSPRYLLIGAVIGFGAMVLRLVRMRPDGAANEAEGESAGPADRPDER